MALHPVVAFLQRYLLQWGLLTPECFSELFIKLNVTHEVCAKAFVAKALGFAIVVGSAMVKLPQVFKLLGAGSADGLSFFGVMLELTAVTANGAYSYANKFPFSAYGEALFLSVQTALIAFLVLWYKGRTVSSLLFTVLYSGLVYAILQPGLVPADILWMGQAANIPMVVVGKMMQIIANYRNGHTGQLSAITVFLLALGSLARIFTSIQETGDKTVIMTYICATTVNMLLAFQVLYYWNAKKVTSTSRATQEHKRKSKPKKA